MIRRFSILLALLLVLVTTVPARAAWPQEFIDPQVQYSSTPQPEHWVFWRQYFYAVFPDSRSWKWWANGVDMRLSMLAVKDRWTLPSDVGAPVEASSANDADVRIYDAVCASGAPGCWSIDTWGTNTGFNIHWWYKSTLKLDKSSGSYSWIDAGTRGVLTHELGHVWGLGEQYTSSGNCNGSSYSVMDAATTDSQGRIIPCDTEYPQTNDLNRFSWYYIGGSYDYHNLYRSGNELVSEWKDAAWMDWNMQLFWYWSNSPVDIGTNFYVQSVVMGNGSHGFVADATNRIIFGKLNPTAHGLTQKWISACTRPVFNDVPNYGGFYCSPAIYWTQ